LGATRVAMSKQRRAPQHLPVLHVEHLNGEWAKFGGERPVVTALRPLVRTAVTSSVAGTPAEVYQAVRKRFALKPVIIAGLSALSSVRTGLTRDFGGDTLHACSERVSWDGPHTLLYVSDTELRGETRTRATLGSSWRASRFRLRA
jgi:hypothetical protein